MAISDDNLKGAWKTFGWDKQAPEAFEAIGTPEFEEILRKRKRERLEFKSIPELVKLGHEEGTEGVARYLKSVDAIVGEGNEYHPDWMDSIFDACDELGWDADKFVNWMWGNG